MDATLTADERLLADTAARVAASLRNPVGGRRPDAGEPVWDVLDGAGFVAMRAEPGAGATVQEVALCVEAFGRALAPGPLVGPLLATELLAVSAAEGSEVASRMLEAVAAGSLRATVGLNQRLSSPVGPGTEPVAFDALGCTAAVGFAGADDGAVPVVWEVRSPRGGVDLTRRLAGVAPGPPEPLGPALPAGAWRRWLAFGLVVVAADMVGAMAGGLGMAIAYAGVRRQFGRPIGAFQAVAHLCAEQHVSVEAARSATYHAAWAAQTLGPSEALGAARVAKAYTARVGRPVGEAVLQVHGGIGHTWEHDAHRYLRRLLVDRAVLGDEHDHEAVLGAGLVDGASGG